MEAIKSYTDLEQSKKFKEKGFNKECFAHYDDLGNLLFDKDYWKLDSHILAPTISQVLKWLREKKGIHIEVSLGRIGWYFEIVKYEYYEEGNEYNCKLITTFAIRDSYEEAAIAGIEYVLDNLLKASTKS